MYEHECDVIASHPIGKFNLHDLRRGANCELHLLPQKDFLNL